MLQREEVRFGGLCTPRKQAWSESDARAGSDGTGTHLVPLHSNEQAYTLEADERRFRSHSFCLIVHGECLCPPAELLEHRSDATSDRGVRRIKLQRLAEVVLGEGGLACLEVDVPEAEPGDLNTRQGAA